MTDLLGRIDALETRLRALEAELAELRREGAPAAAPAPAPAAPPAAPRYVTTAQPAAPPPAAPVYATAATTPPRPPAPPKPPGPSLRDRLPDVEASDLVGAQALAWVGGAVTLLGIVFFFVLAVNRGWVSAELRVAFGAIVSVGLYAAAWWIHLRLGNLYASLAAAGAGIAGAYATLIAATSLYELIPQPVALGASAGVAVVGVATALAWNAEMTAALGLVGAMLGPELIEGLDPSGVGAVYVAVGLAAAIVLGIRRGWIWTLAAAGLVSLYEVAALFYDRDPADSTLAAALIGVFALLYLAAALTPGALESLRTAFLAASGLTAAGIVGMFYDDPPPDGSVAVVAVLWLAYLAAGVWMQIAGRKPSLSKFAATIILGSVSLALLAAHVIFDGTDTGWALLVVAAVTAAPILLLVRVAGQRNLWTLLWAAALAVLAVAAGHLLGGDGLVLAWSAQGALAAWAAVITREERLQLAGIAYLGLAIGHTLIYEAPPDELFRDVSSPENAIPAILFVALGTAVFAAASRFGRLPPPEGFRAAAAVSGAAALYAASFGLLSLLAFEWAEASITVMWAAVALALLVAGLLRPSADLHWAGFGLFALAGAKLVFFDVESLTEIHAAWAGLGFGLLALAAGYAEGLLGERVAPVMEPLRLTLPSLLFLPVSAIASSLALIALLDGSIADVDEQGAALLLLAAAYGALAATVFGRTGRRDLATLLWGLGAAVAVYSFSEDLLDGQWLVLAWAALGAGLAWLGRTTRDERFLAGSATLVGLALAYALAIEAPPNSLFRESAGPASGVPSLCFAGLGLVALALCIPDGPLRRYAYWVTGAVALFAGSLAILGAFQWPAGNDTDAIDAAFQRGHTAVSAAWVLVGLALLVFGLRRGNRPLRLAGLALFGLALGKIFLYDLANLSSLARAFSFLAVGGVLLVAALLYQRLTEERAAV